MGSSAPLQFSDNSSHLVFWHQIFDTTMMYLNRFDPQPTYKWIISATLLLSMVTILVIETSVPRDRRRLPVAKYTPSSFEHAKLRHQNRKAGTIPSQGHNYFGAPELQGDAFVTPDNTTCKRRGSNKVPSLDDLDLERSGFVECGSAKCPNGYKPVKCTKHDSGIVFGWTAESICANLYNGEHYCDAKCFNAENPE